MPHAPTWILIDLYHQLLDGVNAVTQHMRRDASGNRYQLIVDHQHSVIRARNIAFDEHSLAVLPGPVKSELHLLRRGKLNGYALPVIAVQRLDHDGIADVFGAVDGVASPIDLAVPRHWQAGVTQDTVGLLLV